MRTCFAYVVTAVVVTGCSSGPRTTVATAPSAVAGTPATINLAITPDSTEPGYVDIAARIQDPFGAPVAGSLVTFTTTSGTLERPTAATDDRGVATTGLTVTATTTVMASVGSLSTSTLVQPPSAAGSTPAGPLLVTLSSSTATGGKDAAILSADVRSGVPPYHAVWNYGDGTTFSGTSTTTSHVYASVGTYTATVTVTDAASRSATATASVAVSPVPVPPTPPPPPPSYSVILSATPTSVVVNHATTLTAVVRAQNGAPAPTSFAWDCNGDDVTDATTGVNTTSCNYLTIGSTTSKVTVTGGSVAGSASTTVTVTAGAPLLLNVVATPLNPHINDQVSVTATVTSTDPVPSALQWEWDLNGDGTYETVDTGLASPQLRSPTFGSVGLKTITVRVTDTATGRQATTKVDLTVW